MDNVEYSSDTDDEDYIPTGAEPDSDDQQLSSGDEVNSNNEGIEKQNSKKRRISRKRKRGKTDNHGKDSDSEPSVEYKIETNPEEAKRRKDALWSDFLKDTNTVVKPKPETNTASVGKTVNNGSPKKEESKIYNSAPKKEESKIYNFAGQEVKVKEAGQSIENVEETSKTEPVVKPQSSFSSTSPSIKKSGGLSSILGKISNKGTKLSTLDKSKLDWNEFKADEGIEDELSLHNKGKDGYLERQAFLQRTDLRQFEIEKNMRSLNRR